MTEDIATIVGAVSIATLALALFVMTTGRTRIAFAIAMFGLTGISLTTAWRTYLAPRVLELKQSLQDRERSIVDLQDHLKHEHQTVVELTAQLSILRLTAEENERANAQLQESVHRQEQIITDLQKTLTAAENHHQMMLEALVTAFAALTTRLDHLGVAIDPPGSTTSADQLAGLLDAIRRTATQQQHPLPPQLLKKLVLLFDARHHPISTPDYQIDGQLETELVEGRRGTYYFIKLLDALSGRSFTFPEHEYTLADTAPRVQAAVAKLNRDVLEDLGFGVGFELFVRGGADAMPFEGPWSSEKPPSALAVLKRGTANRYLPATQLHEFGNSVRNEDLPDLRAAWIGSMLATAEHPVVILDNSPAETVGEMFRTAEIVLFIPW